MSVSTHTTGNGVIDPSSEWSFYSQEIAQEITRMASLAQRVLNITKTLAGRISVLEYRIEKDPQPQDFDLPDDEEFPEDNVEQDTAAVSGVSDNELCIDADESEAQPEAATQLASTAGFVPQVSIDQKLLADSLKLIVKALPRSAANPVFHHLHCKVAHDSMTITGTDGDFFLRQTIAAAGYECEFLVRGKQLFETVAKLPLGNVMLIVGKTALGISAGTTSCSVPLAELEYPQLPDYRCDHLASLNAGLLRQVLKLTLFATISRQSQFSVHYCSGLFLNFQKGRLDVVATDGHRLALSQNEGMASKRQAELLIPAWRCKQLESLLPEDWDAQVDLFQQDDQVFFELAPYSTGKRTVRHFAGLLVSCRLMDIKFPNYERIIPSTAKTKLRIDRQQLIASLARALSVQTGADCNPVVKLSSAGERLTISADGGENGQVEETIVCDAAGADIAIGLNPAYLLDVVKVLGGDTVTLNWTDNSSPFTITSPRQPDYIYIQMPVRPD